MSIMSTLKKTAFFSLLILLANPALARNQELKEIAVVDAKYDDISRILDKYRISYETCKYKDLENEELYQKYRAIFFPCGIKSPVETNLNVLSRGTRIQSVSLKKEYRDVNETKVYDNIKSFIENGGNAYLGGYSYKFLNGAFQAMEFYENFPNMGISGTINLELKNSLKLFCGYTDTRVRMPHPGWIVVKSIEDSTTLAESEFKTVQDIKRSPIISCLERGKGEAIYSSYHNGSCNDDLQRYMIYRLAYKYLLNSLVSKILAWEQDAGFTIIDSVREWEVNRSYIVPLKKGNNTIYFISDKGYFQIDIYDMDNNLVLSQDARKTEFFIEVMSDLSQDYTLKVFPENNGIPGVYSIVSANGPRIFPYYKKAIYILIILAVIIALYWLNKTFGPKKFSGRRR